MEILLLLGIYCVELVCYQVVLKILFQVEVRNRKWMVLGGVLAVVIGMLQINDDTGKNLLITFTVFIILFISLEGRITEIGVQLILALLLFACIEGIFAFPFENFLFGNECYMSYMSYFLSKCCTGVTLIVFYVLKQKFIQYNLLHINSAIYFIIGAIIVLMLFCLGILNQVIDYFPNSRFIFLCNILNISIFVSIFLLVVFVIYIKNTHERMEQLLNSERLLKESQVNYYKQILKKETETRKYRHDMINHLVYVQEVLSRKQIKEAQDYLANILGGFKKIQNIYHVTGNDMVDTIMNYFVGMFPKDAIVQVKGRCPVIIDMEDTDVCTIFSNLFQNAVEEIKENNIVNSRIIIDVYKGRQYVEYRIKNSIFKEIDEVHIDKNGLPKSCKRDKRNHGIGMINIKNAVERGGGKFEWTQNNGYFCVSVILPIK